MFQIFNAETGETFEQMHASEEAARAACLKQANLSEMPEDGYCGFDYLAIDESTVYMTAGRDYNAHSGYEFLIGAYPAEPQRGNTGEPFPVTLHRKGGFSSNAAAKRAGLNWWNARLTESVA